MRITKKYLQRIIREEVSRLAEDSISDELDHLRKNIDDDKDHIDNLEKDIEEDREEMEHAHEAEKEKNESRRRRGRLSKAQLRRIVREAIDEDEDKEEKKDEELEETHGAYHQGYDAREDESLGMRHGPEAGYEEDEEARRDDSYGAWGRRGLRGESRKRKALKRQLAKTIREVLRKRR